MINYIDRLGDITHDQLDGGFFENWPNPPSTEKHRHILRGSYPVIVAMDDETGKVVGFITAITDGNLCAYIPLLEVLPGYRGQGIGRELMSRMLNKLKAVYMVDLMCDEDNVEFYESMGMKKAVGMCIRNSDRQSCV